jgi:hypothetical protein
MEPLVPDGQLTCWKLLTDMERPVVLFGGAPGEGGPEIEKLSRMDSQPFSSFTWKVYVPWSTYWEYPTGFKVVIVRITAPFSSTS